VYYRPPPPGGTRSGLNHGDEIRLLLIEEFSLPWTPKEKTTEETGVAMPSELTRSVTRSENYRYWLSIHKNSV